jgi:hypothetical protein
MIMYAQQPDAIPIEVEKEVPNPAHRRVENPSPPIRTPERLPEREPIKTNPEKVSLAPSMGPFLLAEFD